MKATDTARLLSGLPRQELDYPLLFSLLRRAGYASPPKKIHDLIKAGALTNVKKGLYTVAPPYAQGPVCRETLANLIYGPSCISLEYALAYYNLIPEQVKVLTSVTPKKDKRFETPMGAFTYRYLTKEKYREEIGLIWVDSQHPVLMASPEKALSDYILLNKISHLETKEDAREFLLEDLRMDPESLKKLDLIAMHRLNRAYRSKSIDRTIAFLERNSP
ncbi:MAG TPA: hypothetical protein VFW62_05360 [bacterium]|nr:hypothetical protein [bacterium]